MPNFKDIMVARDVIFVKDKFNIGTIIQKIEWKNIQSLPELKDELKLLGLKEIKQELLDMIEVLLLLRQETRSNSTSVKLRTKRDK